MLFFPAGRIGMAGFKLKLSIYRDYLNGDIGQTPMGNYKIFFTLIKQSAYF
jgi:hypothetical protein